MEFEAFEKLALPVLGTLQKLGADWTVRTEDTLYS